MKTVRRILIVSGGIVIGYAVSGALTDDDVKLGALGFLIAVLVAHDGLLLPLTIGVGALLDRIIPAGLRRPVRVATIVSLAVTVVAFPLVLGRGRVSDNPSVLPLHYGRGLLAVYAIIWATTAAVVAAQRRRRRPRRADEGRDPQS